MSSPDQIIQFLLLHPILFMVIIMWILLWKGIALWISARRDERNWFVAILILNTLGVLDIIYILYAKNKEKKESEEENGKEEDKTANNDTTN
ncbi:MAG: DUF5652 family protein [Patescibacteria group bacterium]